MGIHDWHGKTNLKIGVGTDHGGWAIKTWLQPWLNQFSENVIDYGPFELNSEDDYPDFCTPLASAVSTGEIDCGILICRSGVGMGINANRFHNVRTVVAYHEAVAKASRDHNCSNILVLPADYMDDETAKKVIQIWMSTPFSNNERHIRRLAKIDELTQNQSSSLSRFDPELSNLLVAESARCENTIDLVASESRSSEEVRHVLGTSLSDKYAEGIPGHRIYPGCEIIDDIENLAIQRACTLFHAEAANVQPYSGSLANFASYLSASQHGDKVMALHPARGGHSTHFSPVHYSGRHWQAIYYGLDPKTELIDYVQLEKLALGCRPKLIVAGGSSYCRFIDFPLLRSIADQIGAVLMVDMAHYSGLIAAGLYPNPFPYADIVTSTTNKTLRGPRGGLILCKKRFIETVNQTIFPLLQGGPLLHSVAAKAVCFKEAMTDSFVQYQKQTVENAKFMTETMSAHGMRIVTGQTDCHMACVDLSKYKIDGISATKLLESIHIYVNPIRLPSDPLNSKNVSGIRFGTLVATADGLRKSHISELVDILDDALSKPMSPERESELQSRVKKFRLKLEKNANYDTI